MTLVTGVNSGLNDGSEIWCPDRPKCDFVSSSETHPFQVTMSPQDLKVGDQGGL